MSATIFWAYEPEGKVLPVNLPSSFIEMFKEVNMWEAILTQDNIPILSGMMAAMRDEEDKKVVQFLIDKILEGNIKLWAGY